VARASTRRAKINIINFEDCSLTRINYRCFKFVFLLLLKECYFDGSSWNKVIRLFERKSVNVTHLVSFVVCFILHSASIDGELLRNQAKLMSSVACCGVPIVTVVVGNSYGMESYMMV